MKTISLIFIIVLLTINLYSTIINVPADQTTIQAGIDAAANTDTVLVQPGTYVENINYNGKLITVGSLFLTTQDTSYISQTIIDGNLNGSVVTFENGEVSTTVLTGFTLTNGYSEHGGGIRCGYTSPNIKNVVIVNNLVDMNGGGIYCHYSDPVLTNVTISGNSANNFGAGIYCDNSYLGFQNVTISGNDAQLLGGGIYCDNSDPVLQNVVISSNSAGFNGGGIYCDNSDPVLQNVTISSNSGGYNGGGIYCTGIDGSDPILVNSILWNDSPHEIYNNSGSVTAIYSDIEGGWVGIGNIDIDPLFVDSFGGDYHLQSISPCIDTGDPASPYDLDNTIADMGAYYFYHIAPPAAEFTADITNGVFPLTVNFTDLSTRGTGAIDEWYWDFGNRINSSLQDPANEYLLPGIYTVSLTVVDVNDSIDTETKIDYITVFGNDPPASPTNVEVNIVYPDAIISWSVVDTTIIGDPALIGGYVVRYNETGYTGDEYFYFLAFTTEPIYTHEFVAQYSTQMFYQVIAIADISRDEIQYLKELNDSHPKIRWSEVKRNLKKGNTSR